MKKDYHLIAPQMSPIHFCLLEQLFQDIGFKFSIVEHVTDEAMSCGLRCVNNDMCCPTIITAGQVINEAINCKSQNPDQKVAIVMTQTGGGCRASNYVGVIRKAISESDYPDIPVVPLAFVPGGDEPWNQLGLKIHDVSHAIRAILLGDAIMSFLYRTRPHELERGKSDDLVKALIRRIRTEGFSKMNKNRFKFWLGKIKQEFAQIAVSPHPKPKVGIVGEILLKYHPDANNHLVDIIEQEGCEAVVLPLIDFFLYCVSGPVFQHRILACSIWKSMFARLAIHIIEEHKKFVNQICGFHWPTIYELAKKVSATQQHEEIISLANSMGEGWLLPAELVDLVEQNCPHAIIAQPFACLPNHSIGQGTLAPICERFPESCVLSVNYDPSASFTNQLNRIKLLVNNAKEYHENNSNQ